MERSCLPYDVQVELQALRQLGHVDEGTVTRLSQVLSFSSESVTGALARIAELDSEVEKTTSLLGSSRLELALSEQLAHCGSYRWCQSTGRDFWSDYVWTLFDCDRETVEPSFEAFAARIHPDERTSVLKRLSSATRRAIPFELEFRLVMSDGRIKFVRSRGRPDGPDHYIGVLMDVSEMRISEAALQQVDVELSSLARQTELGEVAASIAHDLNQPLTSVAANSGAASRWLDRANPEVGKAIESLSKLARDARRASIVLTETQRMQLPLDNGGEPFAVDALLDEIAASSQAALQAHGVVLELDFDAAGVISIGSATQIGQVVYNLIINGIEAMVDGGAVTRRLSVSSCLLPNGFVDISVADTGCGMDRETANRVFESFFTTKRNGMGLGLAICRSIVQRHGGTIEVQSSPGQGATFRFRLPGNQGKGQS